MARAPPCTKGYLRPKSQKLRAKNEEPRENFALLSPAFGADTWPVHRVAGDPTTLKGSSGVLENVSFWRGQDARATAGETPALRRERPLHKSLKVMCLRAKSQAAPCDLGLSFLFVTQRDHGVHGGSAAGGQTAGQERNYREQQHGGSEYQGIHRLDPI